MNYDKLFFFFFDNNYYFCTCMFRRQAHVSNSLEVNITLINNKYYLESRFIRVISLLYLQSYNKMSGGVAGFGTCKIAKRNRYVRLFYTLNNATRH